MALAAMPEREQPFDALLARAMRLVDLPKGARVGTSSLRRACQLRRLRPDLQIADLRGNVDTRLRKLHEGQYDAIVLAAAGLRRLGLAEHISELLPPERMLPAVGQGALGIEVRAGDTAVAALLARSTTSRARGGQRRARLSGAGSAAAAPGADRGLRRARWRLAAPAA